MKKYEINAEDLNLLIQNTVAFGFEMGKKAEQQDLKEDISDAILIIENEKEEQSKIKEIKLQLVMGLGAAKTDFVDIWGL